jgi:hypothetical protein
VVRLDLRGDQRKHYLFMAAVCAVGGTGFGGILLIPTTIRHDDLRIWYIGGFAVLMWVVAVYYLRVAYGWIELDAEGLRTSRLLRGRLTQWGEIDRVSTRTYYGRIGTVTVIRVHTTAGRTFYLPAPRTTSPGDPEFYKAVLDLRIRMQTERS